MTDTVLTLGDFRFDRFEVPEKIPFGGEQAIAVQKLVGGKRIIDAMGREDMPLDWSGLLFGENALVRARYLNSRRIDGLPLVLSWSEFRYSVIIRRFSADFNRFYQLPYQISCEVIEDLANPVGSLNTLDIDSLINGDLKISDSLVSDIGDNGVASSYGVFKTALNNVSNFAKATTNQINAVLQPLADTRSQVAILIASYGNTIRNVTTLGGILPNNPVATSAANILNQVTALTNSPKLANLDSVLSRMAINLSGIHSAQTVTTVAGGNLFNLAKDFYGDAMGWTAIAQANNITDPKLQGINTLQIPPYNNDTGGVLNG